MIVARYILEIISDEEDATIVPIALLTDERVRADLPAMLEELEENLTKMLPEGYKARIGVK